VQGDTAHHVLADLDAILNTASPQERARMLNGLAALFLQTAPMLDRAGKPLFEAIFQKLLDGAETPLVAKFASQVASSEYTPEDLALRLARDSAAAIAISMLAQSPQIAHADIIAIASHCDATRLFAIAQRAKIDEDLAALIVSRCDQATADRLAINPGARFRIADFAKLLAHATADDRGRVVTRQPADIVAMNGAITGTAIMLDISPGGTKLEGPVAASDKIAVELPQIERLRLEGRVAWRARGMTGIQFPKALRELFA
jgi:uncharacterized protein (DUF2336 family)